MLITISAFRSGNLYLTKKRSCLWHEQAERRAPVKRRRPASLHCCISFLFVTISKMIAQRSCSPRLFKDPLSVLDTIWGQNKQLVFKNLKVLYVLESFLLINFPIFWPWRVFNIWHQLNWEFSLSFYFAGTVRVDAFYCVFTVNYSSTSSHPLLLLPWKLAFKNEEPSITCRTDAVL